MRVNNIGWNLLYVADRAASLVPGVSTISGMTDFVIKIILQKKTASNQQLNRYFSLIKTVSYEGHLMTAVPIVGNFLNGLALVCYLLKIDPNEKKPAPLKDALKEIVKKANLKQPASMFKLANAFLEGKGVKKNREKAISLFEEILSLYDSEIKESPAKSIADIAAKTRIALCKIYTEDQKLDQAASEWLSNVMLRDRLKPSCLKMTLKRYLSCATSNDVKAMKALGEMYAEGRVVRRSAKTAFEWHKKAADLGGIEAMLVVASRYDRGFGVEKDPQKAFTYYEKAALADNIEGIRMLAKRYQKGIGVAPDTKMQIKWAKQAAKKGNANDKYQFAELFRNGIKLPSDTRMYFWYQQAAREGHVDAMYQYGIFLAYKENQTADAIFWLSRASENGHSLAGKALKVLYAREPKIQST